MIQQNHAVLRGSRTDAEDDPLRFVTMVGGCPRIDFHWKQDTNGKRRLIGNPNKPLRRLHRLFGQYLEEAISKMGKENYELIKFPSSTAFVRGTNPLKNAQKHQKGRFFYITDFANAYPSVDLVRLAVLIVYIKRHNVYGLEMSLRMLGQNRVLVRELQEDPLFLSILAFLESYCSGQYGRGLAVGGPRSPYLFNLYCEVYADAGLRKVCERYGITFTRYADDNVFSRDKPITSDIRRELRRRIESAGFQVNHRKSKVLCRDMGTVFVTKVGLRDQNLVAPRSESAKAAIVFPKKKRRRLHGIIGSYLHMQMDWPEKVSGRIAEFLHYYRHVERRTAADHKTFALCKEFEREWAKYRKRRK